MIRLFVEAPLTAGVGVELVEGQAHYLRHVMRQSAGAPVALFNGRDGEWRARLAVTGRRGASAEVEACTRAQADPPDLELVMALVKRARLETIVEKATELGARRIRLIVTRRSQADRANTERLRAIAIEAAEQTGRLDVPEVLGPEPLESVLDGWTPGRALAFCDEAGEAPPLPAAAPAAPAALLIGPEGGFGPAERARLRALPFVTPVALGPRILRADTAAIAALTLWQATFGDWR